MWLLTTPFSAFLIESTSLINACRPDNRSLCAVFLPVGNMGSSCSLSNSVQIAKGGASDLVVVDGEVGDGCTTKRAVTSGSHVISFLSKSHSKHRVMLLSG